LVLGVTLGLRYLRGGGRWPGAGIAHGLMGAAGFGLLVIALQGPRHGDAMGVGSFGIAAALLFGIALAFGPFIPISMRRTPRFAGLLLATHATLAITAYVLFLAWASL
jgi:hypothetical protein